MSQGFDGVFLSDFKIKDGLLRDFSYQEGFELCSGCKQVLKSEGL